MTVSVVMTTFNRPAQLRATLASIRSQAVPVEIAVVDDGSDMETPGICAHGQVEFYRQLNRPSSPTQHNQSLPLNIGIRAATGDVLIIQNAECLHVDPVIAGLTSFLTGHNTVFAQVVALDQSGIPGIDYCSLSNPRPYFFCGAIRRDTILRLRGFDEDYLTAGWEDDDMADRLRREGVEFLFTDIRVYHQWHPPAKYDPIGNQALFERKRGESTARNLGREWGQL